MLDKIFQTLQTAESLFYIIATASVILLVGFAIGFTCKKLLSKVLHQIELNKILSKRNIFENGEEKISTAVSYIIYFITIVLVLNRLNITSLVVASFIGIVVLLFSLTIFVSLRDSIPNFWAGRWLRQKQEKELSTEKICVNNITGLIEHTGYFEVRMRTKSGDILHIPNTLIKSSLEKNSCKNGD
ncbi:mechanosensitive ion channel family protein [Candidatus Woesearchaeota archaeon]|nr:mechanosensitive ion channel family protein [Candidatus Woesearchaeota archaeon]